MGIEYSELGRSNIDLIGPLWEKLMEYHRERSPRHARLFEKLTWEGRRDSMLQKCRGGAFRLDIARDGEAIAGYCMSTVMELGQGEIDSIYIEAKYRGQGIGDAFMKRALAWMDGLSSTSRIVVVGAGNEEVFSFYERYGFYPRTIVLEQVKETSHPETGEGV
jgi:ribosomal protein S18 acetylase RimI-like enzyme